MGQSAAIAITNNSGTTALAQSRTCFVVIDHAALVAAKRSRLDGKDIRVSWAGSTPPRALATYVSRPNTTYTRVYFSLQASIGTGVTDNDYTLAWGNLDFQGPKIRVTGLSQFWPGDYGPRSVRSQPFLWFDDFAWTTDGSINDWIPTQGGDSLSSLLYDTLNPGIAIERDDSGLSPDVWCAVDAQADTRAMLQSSDLDALSAYRVRAECYAESGATDPSGGLLGFGQDHASDIRGYTGGLEQSYSVLGIVGHTAIGEVPLDTTAGGSVADGVLDLQFDIRDTGSATTTRLWARLPGTSSFVSVAAFSDPTRTFTSGYPGFFSDGATSSSPKEVIQFRDFAVELWDGVPDSDISTSVTIPSTVSFPTNFEPPSEALRYPTASTSYPQHVNQQRVTVYEQDLGTVQLTWQLMLPDDYYQLIAFYEQSKGSQTFTATLPGLSSATYRIQPGSLRTSRASATRYGATCVLRKVAV